VLERINSHQDERRHLREMAFVLPPLLCDDYRIQHAMSTSCTLSDSNSNIPYMRILIIQTARTLCEPPPWAK